MSISFLHHVHTVCLFGYVDFITSYFIMFKLPSSTVRSVLHSQSKDPGFNYCQNHWDPISDLLAQTLNRGPYMGALHQPDGEKKGSSFTYLFHRHTVYGSTGLNASFQPTRTTFNIFAVCSVI